MIEAIHGVINAISGFLYQPYIVPLFLIAAGLYFTVRTGFLQGIPIVGAVGGAYDPIYIDRITRYASMKYNRRFLHDIKNKHKKSRRPRPSA